MNKQRAKSRVWSWEIVGAVCCFGGGIAAALIGTLLTAIAWFIGAQFHPWLHAAGTGLLVATIPLLIFSGYCLDWSERKEVLLQRRPHRGAFQEGRINDLARDQRSSRTSAS